MKIKNSVLAAAASVGLLSTSSAAFINYNLPGTSDFDAWDDLSVSNPQVATVNAANGGQGGAGAFPGFGNGGDLWPEAIDSVLTQGTTTTTDDDPTGDATFDKVSGNGYPAGSSIYGMPFPPAGTFTVADATPVADLEQVIFQIEVGSGSAGWLNGDPTLTVNTGSGATTVSLFDSGTVSSVFDPNGPFGPVTVNTFAYQWDLSTIVGTITDFNVDYTLDGTSAQIYQMQMDQGNTFSAQAVPEPATFGLALALAVLGLAAIRRPRLSRR